MTCPHLEYRSEAAGKSFDVERAYCAVAGEFVQPMRADVCNDRYDFDHAEHCEIFREHEAEQS
jgi:hypothetical protein